MMTTIRDMDKARLTMGANDSLSKQGARAVMFVFLLAVLMALSAIFLILSSERYRTAASERLPDIDGRSALPRSAAQAAQPAQPWRYEVELRA
jgi:hypothetical protein